jgi:release factor glutamine methyltransferase
MTAPNQMMNNKSQPTIATVYRDIISRLSPSLGDGESRAAARVIMEDVRGATPTDLVVNGDRTVEPPTLGRIYDIVARIISGEPVQYAVGSARFYGMDFTVTPDVLIPRPETEGLVDMIVSQWSGRDDLRVLDCGTGSGCIAIALARNLPFSAIDAIDISNAALKVAEENSRRLKTSVGFYRRDILKLTPPDAPLYDIIVSNPPYIARDEAAAMDDRVLGYEPAGALFVPDDNPLIFYRAISAYAVKALKAGGRLYFEINPRFRDAMTAMLADDGFTDIDTRRDYLGRYRFVSASKPAI